MGSDLPRHAADPGGPGTPDQALVTRLPDIDFYRQAQAAATTVVVGSQGWRDHVDVLARACPPADRMSAAFALLAAYVCRVAEEREAVLDVASHGMPAASAAHGRIRVAIDGQEPFPRFCARVVAQMGQLAASSSGRVSSEPAPCLVVTLGQQPVESANADVHIHIDTDGVLACQVGADVAGDFGELLAARLESVAASVVREPARPLVWHEVMSTAERHQVVSAWNATDIDYGYGGGLVAMFERAATSSPEHPALIFKDEVLSFSEFNSRVNRLARMLVRRGVGKDVFVCLCMERSTELVVAIWAILKAGGAYVPLNTEDPVARIEEIISDCKPAAILAQAKFADALRGHSAIFLGSHGSGIDEGNDLNLGAMPEPHALAYMIYTSGSTGRPKGVTIEHEAIHNRVVWMHREYGLEPGHRILQKTPYTFDVSVWEFLWSFAYGSTLVVAEPGGHASIRYLHDLIRDRGVTHLHFVPSMLRLFLMLPSLKDLPIRRLFCSGEALPADSVAAFYRKANDIAEVHNLYGPTEAAVDVSYFHCVRDAVGSVVPIGRPVANTGLYVLDENGQPCPIGVPGELHIGGIQLARGYWAREDLTAQRFVACAIDDVRHKRLYKTGDLACFRPDGEIVYLGRNDFQVKISGVRIEPGEIEAVIRSDATTQDVVVVAEQTGGNKALIAYVLSSDPQPARAETLKQLIAASRPPQYVPREVRFLKQMPLTTSGKVDRKLLANAPRA